MAVRPKRKDPISTRPIYLPRVPARELRSAASAGAPAEGSRLLVYVDGAPGAIDVEGLAQRLAGWGGHPVGLAGEVVSILAGRPQTEVRHAVAAAAHRLAWARISDPARFKYRVLPLRGEVDREEARLRARSQPQYEGLRAPLPPAGVLYDGAEVQAAYRELLPPEEGDGGGTTFIVITDRRLARWDAKTKRWTPLAVVAGHPVVVSVGDEERRATPDTAVSEVLQALQS